MGLKRHGRDEFVYLARGMNKAAFSPVKQKSGLCSSVLGSLGDFWGLSLFAPGASGNGMGLLPF